MKFSKKELYEIEKVFDIYAGQILSGFASLCDKTKTLPKDLTGRFIDKFFKETMDSFDLVRTISAKAAKLREGK